MKRPAAQPTSPRRVLIFVDESNVTSSAKVSNRKLDWLKLRDFLVRDRELLEMVVYAGLPPAMTEWQAERDRENKFLHWLRAHGILVVTKEGASAAEARDGLFPERADLLQKIGWQMAARQARFRA